VGQKKYNGLELDERTGACFVGHGFSRDTKTLKRRPIPLGGRFAEPYAGAAKGRSFRIILFRPLPFVAAPCSLVGIKRRTNTCRVLRILGRFLPESWKLSRNPLPTPQPEIADDSPCSQQASKNALDGIVN
jgi:hypothetical protein